MLFYHISSVKAIDIKRDILSRFKCKDLGSCSFILGLEMKRDRKLKTISIGQQSYTKKLLERFNMFECSQENTPADCNVIFTKDGVKGSINESKDFNKTIYQQAIGSLIFLMVCSRPDITFAVSMLARFMSCPKEVHWEGVKRIFRYLKKTINYGLVYDGSKDLELLGYADANYVSDLSDCRSTTGYLYKLSNAAILWKSSKQTSVARSTADAEYMSVGLCSTEAVWIKNLMMELEIKLLYENPVKIFGDNQCCLKIISNPIFHNRMKHIAVQYYYTRELVNDKIISLEYIKSSENTADLFTKALDKKLFEYHRNSIGVWSLGESQEKTNLV